MTKQLQTSRRFVSKLYWILIPGRSIQRLAISASISDIIVSHCWCQPGCGSYGVVSKAHSQLNCSYCVKKQSCWAENSCQTKIVYLLIFLASADSRTSLVTNNQYIVKLCDPLFVIYGQPLMLHAGNPTNYWNV